MAKTPRDGGWRMPAEWDPHEATWLAWPHHEPDWPGKFGPIPWVYADIVRHLHTGEFVHLLVQNADAEAEVRDLLSTVGVDLTRVRFFPFPTDRVWLRDSGPIFLVNDANEVAASDWRFNAWAKYPNWEQDDQVPLRIAKALGLPHFQPQFAGKRVVLEGGSIDVNGAGLLLTTEECLLSPVQERNPGMRREDYEAVFKDHLGIEKVLWLSHGIVGDDTHGHVDDLARFVAPGRIVAAYEENRSDPNFSILDENWRRLESMKDASGKKFEVIKLPMPDPVLWEGDRLPASYANFYIGNEKVLVPTFNDGKDRLALGILADLFPDRSVVGIHCLDLVLGLGTLHCMSQQQPRGSRG